MAALTNTQLLNFSSISSDIGLSVSTVREYYYLLEDTFLGFMVEPYKALKNRKSISTAKFYFFDCGIARVLAGLSTLLRKSSNFGQALEHFILLELKCFLHYTRSLDKIYFFRTTTHQEVDFIIPGKIAIEVKATESVKDKHLQGLKVVREELSFSQYLLVSLDPIEKVIDGIHCMSIETFIKRLWEKRDLI